MNETKVPENRAYKVTLILLLGLAAFSTAMKELNRLREMVSSVQEFAREWDGNDSVTPNENPISPQGIVSTNASCPNQSFPLIGSSAEFDLSNSIAAATDGYMEGVYYDSCIEPEVGAKVDVIVGKRPKRAVPQLARAKFPAVRNLREEVSSIGPDKGNWPARFEYKALDQSVSFELPMTIVNHIKAERSENEVSPDFLLGLLGRVDRKQSSGKTEIRRRELMIKRFERSINSRRAS